ncbi:hypothetical protein V6N13_052566 [Hibiscus sabdariffa]|uniref:RNase H type-1 domain-containing protein n=1 Tax=Hibiscus sabdariffa TaxID=183260 RepID=A0ABR2Q5A5_9ROSI
MLARAWSLEFRRVVIETDCLEVVKILKRTSQALVSDGLVESIYRWTRKEWKLMIQHVPMDRNHLVDKVAVLGRAESRNNIILLTSPATLVEDDIDRSPIDLVNVQDWLRTANMFSGFIIRDDDNGTSLPQSQSQSQNNQGVEKPFGTSSNI